MLRHGDLNDKGMTLIDENGREYNLNSISSKKYRWKEIDQELVTKRAAMRLITRVCSILPCDPFIRHNQSWRSKLSHELSAFNQVSTSYHRELRNLLDSVLCWIYCSPNVDKSPKFLHAVADKESSIVMGVVFEEFVRDFGSLNWANIKNDQNNTRKEKNLLNYLNYLRNKFPLFTKLPEAILCCMKFFKQICVLVDALSGLDALDKDIALQFKSAYEYLNNKSHIFDAIEAMEKIVIKQHPVIRAVLEHTVEDPFKKGLNSDTENDNEDEEESEAISLPEKDKNQEILRLEAPETETAVTKELEIQNVNENSKDVVDHLRDTLELD
ncbi:hypothetical protein RFI_24556 [Reticulomyxa filosa]|uniref:Post-transcriptional regulator MKT1 C-terminal domain-containing protein n=1 Tax=Reticulomyxa filosa TaxID=46433 RepID=X6MID2_RETFI|nr:hypothetical protein RFI_24556 [Reticulomyxa filosa]|eukprot:ETO12820.1 hypothetical protein RFI_24556 [Reticulomyxa filosa]